MGLDFVGAEARWSYGGFNRFRARLATEIGIELSRMKGFGGVRPWSTVRDRLKPLLNHSDCDGLITAKQCAKVAPRLREIVSKWKGIELEYDKQQALLLAEGMERCARQSVSLIFC
jgi:hypothetical protein